MVLAWVWLVSVGAVRGKQGIYCLPRKSETVLAKKSAFWLMSCNEASSTSTCRRCHVMTQICLNRGVAV